MISIYSTLSHLATELAWAGAIGILVFGLELLWPASDRSTRASRLFNAASVTLLFSAVTLLPLLSNPIVGWLGNQGLIGLVFGNWHSSTLAGQILLTLAYVAVWDFFQYWLHRAEHTFAPLWAIHLFHHEDDHLNGTTSLRNSAWSILANFFFVSLPTLILCGVDMIPVVGAYLFFKVYGFFNHANVRLSLGPATAVLSGPQWHRLHHGRDSHYHNKNFAAFFPVLDIVFGTYRKPARDEFPETGLTDYPPPPLTIGNALRRVFALSSWPITVSTAPEAPLVRHFDLEKLSSVAADLSSIGSDRTHTNTQPS